MLQQQQNQENVESSAQMMISQGVSNENATSENQQEHISNEQTQADSNQVIEPQITDTEIEKQLHQINTCTQDASDEQNTQQMNDVDMFSQQDQQNLEVPESAAAVTSELAIVEVTNDQIIENPTTTTFVNINMMAQGAESALQEGAAEVNTDHSSNEDHYSLVDARDDECTQIKEDSQQDEHAQQNNNIAQPLIPFPLEDQTTGVVIEKQVETPISWISAQKDDTSLKKEESNSSISSLSNTEDAVLAVKPNFIDLNALNDSIEVEKDEEGDAYMEQEEIVIKKGKKVKQTKQIKLREYSILQPDYALTPGAVLVYHQDRLTQIHEQSCQGKVKTIAGDLLPEPIQVPSTATAAATEALTDTSASQSLKEEGASTPKVVAVQPPKKVPSTMQIETPLITPEQLFDFQISQVRIFQKSDRLLQDQDEPEYIFPDMQNTMKNVNKAELHIRKFVKKTIQRRRVTPHFKPEKLIDPPKPLYIHNIDEKTIFFNAQFESGNLREVERIKENEYNMFLNFDHNTLNYSQWYFFSVRNIGKGHTVRFNINNLQKDESTYTIGMKPFVYSIKQNRQDRSHEWQRGGHDVRYYKNNHKTMDRECAPDYDWDQEMIVCYEYEDEVSMKMGLNTLSFSYTFEHENDTVFFSYFQPYTFSDLQDLLFVLKSRYPEEHLNNVLKIQKLCETMAGNPCYILTITTDVQKNDIKISALTGQADKSTSSKKDSQSNVEKNNQSSQPQSTSNGNQNQSSYQAAASSQNVNESGTEGAEKETNKEEGGTNEKGGRKRPKQVIFLTARVHPGESNASFMVHGAIEFLLQQNDREAQLLRDTFIFKIVPMLNPDGVIIGNYRCNMVGADLNRRWPNPSRLLHPTIYFTKKLVAQYHKENQVILFCDMHGHSRKRNVFMYGCVSGQSEINQHKNNNLIKVLPYFLAQKNRLFSFSDCKFANEKDKEATARLVMFKQFGIINSYTLESTFYAAFNPKNQYLQSQKRKPVEDDQQLKSSELITVGHDFCSTLIAMINSKILKRKFTVDTSLNHLYQMNQKAFKKSLSMISSKDDSATTASLLGFAIANRVDAASGSAMDNSGRNAKDDNNQASSKNNKDDKDHDKPATSKGGKEPTSATDKDNKLGLKKSKTQSNSNNNTASTKTSGKDHSTNKGGNTEKANLIKSSDHDSKQNNNTAKADGNKDGMTKAQKERRKKEREQLLLQQAFESNLSQAVAAATNQSFSEAQEQSLNAFTNEFNFKQKKIKVRNIEETDWQAKRSQTQSAQHLDGAFISNQNRQALQQPSEEHKVTHTHGSSMATHKGTNQQQHPVSGQKVTKKSQQKQNFKSGQQQDKQQKTNAQASAHSQQQNSAQAAHGKNSQSVSPSKRQSRTNAALGNNASQALVSTDQISKTANDLNSSTNHGKPKKGGNKANKPNKSKTIEKATSSLQEQPQQNFQNGNDYAGFVLKKQNIDLAQSQKNQHDPEGQNSPTKFLKVQEKKMKTKQAPLNSISASQQIQDPQNFIRQIDPQLHTTVQNYSNNFIAELGVVDLQNHPSQQRNAYSQFEQHQKQHQPFEQKTTQLSQKQAARAESMAAPSMRHNDTEDDPFFYHLDLSQYRDTLDWHQPDETNHFQLKEARLNSHRSGGGNRNSVIPTSSRNNERYRQDGTQEDKSNQDEMMSRVQVPTNLPSADINGRNVVNHRNDQFLVSGGSIERYLRSNNIDNTESQSQTNFIAQEPSTPSKGGTISPFIQGSGNQGNAPPMSNLIIAMALQNNFTQNNTATNQVANPQMTTKAGIHLDLNSSSKDLANIFKEERSPQKSIDASARTIHQTHHQQQQQLLTPFSNTAISSVDHQLNQQTRSTPYQNHANTFGNPPTSGGALSSSMHQPAIMMHPNSMTPSARTVNQVSKSQVGDAASNILTNDQVFAYWSSNLGGSGQKSQAVHQDQIQQQAIYTHQQRRTKPMSIKRPSMNSTHGGGGFQIMDRDNDGNQSKTSIGHFTGQYKTSQSFFPSDHSHPNYQRSSHESKTSSKPSQQARAFYRSNSKRSGNNNAHLSYPQGGGVFQNHTMAIQNQPQHQYTPGISSSGKTARIVSKKLSASKIKINEKRSQGLDFQNQSALLDISATSNDIASQSMVLNHSQQVDSSANQSNDYMLSMQQNMIQYNQQRMRFIQATQGQSQTDQLPSLIQVHKTKSSGSANTSMISQYQQQHQQQHHQGASTQIQSEQTTLQDVNKFSANPGSVVAGAINGYPQHKIQTMTKQDQKKLGSAKQTSKKVTLMAQNLKPEQNNYAAANNNNISSIIQPHPVVSLNQIRATADQFISQSTSMSNNQAAINYSNSFIPPPNHHQESSANQRHRNPHKDTQFGKNSRQSAVGQQNSGMNSGSATMQSNAQVSGVVVTSSPPKRHKTKMPSSKLTTLNGSMGLVANSNLQKMVKANSGQGNGLDFSQFRGVTDNAGGVFGMGKQEVTEFDLKLVYKHQQAQQQLKNSQIPAISSSSNAGTNSGTKGAVRLVHASVNNSQEQSSHSNKQQQQAHRSKTIRSASWQKMQQVFQLSGQGGQHRTGASFQQQQQKQMSQQVSVEEAKRSGGARGHQQLHGAIADANLYQMQQIQMLKSQQTAQQIIQQRQSLANTISKSGYGNSSNQVVIQGKGVPAERPQAAFPGNNSRPTTYVKEQSESQEALIGNEKSQPDPQRRQKPQRKSDHHQASDAVVVGSGSLSDGEGGPHKT